MNRLGRWLNYDLNCHLVSLVNIPSPTMGTSAQATCILRVSRVAVIYLGFTCVPMYLMTCFHRAPRLFCTLRSASHCFEIHKISSVESEFTSSPHDSKNFPSFSDQTHESALHVV